MEWTTTSGVHFDRVISAWLIRRFIDRAATFHFVPIAQSLQGVARSFGAEGACFPGHESGGTAFGRLRAAHDLEDLALIQLEHLTAHVVVHVVGGADVDAVGAPNPDARGVLTIAEGVMLLSGTDQDYVSNSAIVFDALYARHQARMALEGSLPMDGLTRMEQTIAFAKAVARQRARGESFSRETFGAVRDQAGA